MVSVSLMDLVNLDRARMLFCCGIIYIATRITVSLDIGLPILVARVILFWLRLFGYAFLIYLSMGIILHFLHFHFRTASILETTGLTDEVLQNIMRLVIGCTSLCLLGWVLSDTAWDNAMLLLTKEVVTEVGPRRFSRNTIVMAILSMLSLLTNTILRVIIFWKKRDNFRQSCDRGEGNQEEFISYNKKVIRLLVAASLAILVGLGVALHSSGVRPRGSTEYLTINGITTVVVCLFLPLGFILSDKGMRRHLLETIMSLCGHSLGGVKVSPGPEVVLSS